MPTQLAVAGPRSGRRGGRPPVWLDRFLGSDPGLNRLRTALQVVTTIGVAMLAEWAFVRATHALEIQVPAGVPLPPQQATLIAAQHHGMTVIAIMLGAIVGMLAGFGGSMFVSRGQLLVNTVLIPVPMTAGLAVGLALGDHRAWALASLVAILTLGAYARRLGPSGFLGGQLTFMGAFFGFFLHAEIALSDLGWVVAEIAIGVAVALLAQFTLFFPSRSAALRRMVRSYVAREREVAARALALFDAPDDRDRAVRLLHRRLTRLNETALMIDAHLAQPGSIPEHWAPAELHQRLFDSELSLTNLVRFAERIAVLDVPPHLRESVHDALEAVGSGDLLHASRRARDLLRQLQEIGRPSDESGSAPDRSTLVVLHRYAVSVLGFVTATEGWRVAVLTGSPTSDRRPFETSVALFGGWLPGSAMVSAAASMEPGERGADRIRLQPYTRTAIQMCVAATAAVVFGQMLSERRFYWAVIAAFVTFMGANNAGEQLRKGFFRVAGTVVGVFLGAVGAHYVGHRTWLAVLVILVSLFFGLYLMRISYAFMVIGITIMVSQLYVQLDEFSNSLLVLRLEETALGAAAAALTVLCVVPLRTGKVVRVAARQYFEALAEFVTAGVARLTDPAAESELRAAARQIDSAYQALTTTMIPLDTPLMKQSDSLRKRLGYAVQASRHYARNLVVDARADSGVPASAGEGLTAAGARLTASLEQIVASSRNNDASERTYVRSAALFEVIASGLGDQLVTSPTQLALRDLQLIDGAMAALADAVGMQVEALDTGDDEPDELAACEVSGSK